MTSAAATAAGGSGIRVGGEVVTIGAALTGKTDMLLLVGRLSSSQVSRVAPFCLCHLHTMNLLMGNRVLLKFFLDALNYDTTF